MSDESAKDGPREPYLERRLRESLGEDPSRIPGSGEPIPDIDKPYDPDWWLKGLLRREKVSDVPPGLKIRHRIETALGELEKLRDEAAVRRRLEELNAEIAHANATVVTGPATTLPLVDVEAMVERWRRSSGRQ